jgi:hypothetical protein
MQKVELRAYWHETPRLDQNARNATQRFFDAFRRFSTLSTLSTPFDFL